MNVSLVDFTQDAEAKIATYSAVCYDSDTGKDANARRITKLLNLGHLATLRFAYATFFVEGVSRTCSHQLVRTKHLDYLQESQRYVDQTGIEIIIPPAIEQNEEAMEAYVRAMRICSYEYSHLRRLGIKKEDARFVLLEASPTKLYMTGNFQAWRDFLRNRTDKSAQWEVRAVAESIGKQLAGTAPNVFKEYSGEETHS